MFIQIVSPPPPQGITNIWLAFWTKITTCFLIASDTFFFYFFFKERIYLESVWLLPCYNKWKLILVGLLCIIRWTVLLTVCNEIPKGIFGWLVFDTKINIWKNVLLVLLHWSCVCGIICNVTPHSYYKYMQVNAGWLSARGWFNQNKNEMTSPK